MEELDRECTRVITSSSHFSCCIDGFNDREKLVRFSNFHISGLENLSDKAKVTLAATRS